MRPLRKILTALSPAIILVSVLCGIISGQSALTTIQDTLFDADGARYNGTLTIRWSTFDTTNPGTIIQQVKTVQVVNGNLLVQLTSNISALPPANLYTVLYQSDGDQQYVETWTVPPSTTPLKVAQVRTGAGTNGGGGGGTVGGLTGGTGTTEASITNLVSDLNARPVKGPGFGTNAVAVIDQNGQIETAVGNIGDCVFVDGTTGPCSTPVTLPTWVNGETPGGLVNGLNATFTLANTPSGSSLLLFRNGLLVQPGVDYTLNGSTVQFTSSSIPQPLDSLVAEYRMDPGSGSPGSNGATGPSGVPGVNGCGAVGAVSKSAAYQILAADNGYLLIQTANANFTLPVTVPVAGWCVALLDTNAANITVANSGNAIDGVVAGYTLHSANTIFVVSDGTAYWVSGGAGGTGAALPSGTGSIEVTGGVASLVAGAATNCVLVNGTSAACGSSSGGTPGGTSGQIQYNNAGSFGAFTPAVNGTGIATPSALNFLNSSAFNGLTFTFSNPSAGGVQLGASGTLNNSGLANSSFTTSLPSWLTGTSPVSLGGSFTVGYATGQTSHQVVGTCGAATTFGPCTLVAGDIPALPYVASVGLSLPSVFSVTGSPVTSSGTLAATLSTQSANAIFAGPSSGSAASPTFRALVGTDLPAPSATTLGGVEAIASATNNWISSIDTSGVPHQSQPAFSNLSGSVACGQQPSLTGDTTTSAGSCGTTTGKVDGVSYPASPATNTVPVVTASNTVTYEAIPNAALANSSVTVNGTTCALGGTCAVTTYSPWARYAVLYGSSTFSVVTVSSSLAAPADQNDIEPCSGYSSAGAHTYVVAYDSTSTFKWNIDGGSYTTGVAITGSSTCQTLSNGFRVSFGHTTGYTTGDSNTFALATPVAAAGALTQDVTLVTPSPKNVVEAVVMYQPSAFAGTSITTLTFSIGRSGTETDFAQPQCLISGTCGTALGTSGGPIYSGGGANILNMASQAIVGEFTSVGANLSAMSAGVVDICLKTSVLP